MKLTTQLAVDHRNMVNKRASDTKQQLQTIFEPYIGKKVWKITGRGGLVAPLKKRFEGFREEEQFNCQGTKWRLWVMATYGWMTAEIDYWHHETSYTKQTINIGRTDNESGVLKEFYEESFKSDYSKDEVEAASEKIHELKQEIYSLEGSIREFTRLYS